MNADELLNSSGEDMDTMTLNYDHPDLMTSDFFDSVLSLENNFDVGLFPPFEDDVQMSSSDTSSHTDVLSPRSLYSERSGSISDNIDESISLFNNLEDFQSPVISFLEQVPQDEECVSVIEEKVDTTPLLQKLPKTTKILIQNPNNKKIISKPIIHTGPLKKTGKPQILKVQSVTNSGRPVLLPLSVKSIKILNANTDLASLTSSLKRRSSKVEQVQQSDDYDSNSVSSVGSQYPPLSLTNEEKRLLAKEGIQLPTHHPLTKNEERDLKRIRRKIRNKISAQDSRKRKKEYVDGLEERVKRGSEENKNLLQRVKELQKQNKNLMAHVTRLQAMICKSTTSKATPSTCLMVVLLSALLVSLPNMRLFENKKLATEQEQLAIRRSLLSSDEDNLNMEEFLVFNEDGTTAPALDEFESKFTSDEVSDIIENATKREELVKKYESWLSEKSDQKNLFTKMVDSIKHFMTDQKNVKNELFYNKHGLVEPDIDDDPGDMIPPLKRMRHMENFDGGSAVALNDAVTVNNKLNSIKESKDK